MKKQRAKSRELRAIPEIQKTINPAFRLFGFPTLRLSGSPAFRLSGLVSCVLCLVIVGSALMQGQIDRIRPLRERLEEKLIYIPTSRFLRTAALGFDAVLADLLWMRAVVYFGGHFLTDKDYRWLYHILDAVTTLDPKNILAYRFGGSLLALEENDAERSIAILKKGIQNNPDEDWRLYFLLGFNYFYFLEDHVEAAKYLERASRMPNHPKYLPKLAAKMYAKAEKIDTAIEFLEEMYQQHDDQNVKAAIAERITILVAKKQARSLEYAAGKYKEAYGEYPRELKLLTHAGLIKELPAYPGGEYIIDPNTGRVDWVSESVPHWP
jgi:tetratricopeptide (TPR) repeat protein